MSPADLSLPVVVLALGLGTAWAVAAAVLSAWVALANHNPAVARTALVAAAVPWLAGLAVVVGSLLPGDPHTGQILACHCLESMPTWLHLCPVHPAEALALAGPALLVLALLAPGRFRAARAVVRAPLGHGGGDAPRLLDLGGPVAMLHGWLRPTLVVDRALWAALDEDARAVVLAHERGHLRRRDPLVLGVLRVLLGVAPAPVAARVLRAWLHRAELQADRAAAQAVGDPVRVATALLRCARLGARAPEGAMAWTGGTVEDRVRALLGDPPEQPVQPDLGVADLALVIALAALAVAATPWVHHQVEHLLNLSL